jgi:zinc protease
MSECARVRSILVRFIILYAYVYSSALLAQPQPQDQAPSPYEHALTAALDEPLPVSPEVLIGDLDNGLRYYIRENREPENRAILRLVVDAGSVLEDDDQLGLAHVLEHMAFNGTESFEKQELVRFMESIGMRLGPGLNASTSFDETVYMLSVPTDEPEHLETAFQIMRDWTSALTLDPEEVDRERLVVIEEWRGSLGAGSRVRDQHLPVILHGSRYAERLPIGTLESLETFDQEALRRFFDDWYRPELMAVIAVGDFDAAHVERLLRERFETLPASEAPRERRRFEVPDHEDTLYSIVADPEMPATTVEIYHKIPPNDVLTVGDYRHRMPEQLYNYLINERLQEIVRQPDAPFRVANAASGRLVRGTEAYMLRAQVPDDGIERGLRALVTEVERVARHGFTEAELERAKRGLLRLIERQHTNRDSRNSAAFAGEYIRAFLTAEPIPGIDYEYGLYQRFLPEVTLEEVNRVGERWGLGASRVVLVTGPEREDVELPDERMLAAVLEEAGNSNVEAYAEAISDGVLLDTPPEPGEIVAVREKAGGIIEWELANGARVVLKPTDFGGDDVHFVALGRGGLSLASDEEFRAVRSAAEVIQAGGVGQLDDTALRRALTGHVAGVSAGIGTFGQTLSGQASVADLETMFQLVYLRLTAPRADRDAFQALKARQRVALANRDRNPGVAFNDTFQRIMTNDHPRSRPMTVDALEEIDLERSLAFYRERFGNANGFTFIFVGAFDLDTMRPLIERYLGALPSGPQPTAGELDVGFPEGMVQETVRRGLEPRSQTLLAFLPPEESLSPSERTLLEFSMQVLETRLRNALRQELGGTYSVGVLAVSYLRPQEVWVPTINFASAPERNEELVERIFEELEALRREGPDESLLADTRETRLRSHETRLRQNGYWAGELFRSYRDDEEPGAQHVLSYESMVESLTRESIREAFERYFDPERYVNVTLVPEG